MNLSEADEIELRKVILSKCKPIIMLNSLDSGNPYLDSISTDRLKEEILLREIKENKAVTIEHYKNSTIYFTLEHGGLTISIGRLNYVLDKDDIKRLNLLFSLLES